MITTENSTAQDITESSSPDRSVSPEMTLSKASDIPPESKPREDKSSDNSVTACGTPVSSDKAAEKADSMSETETRRIDLSKPMGKIPFIRLMQRLADVFDYLMPDGRAEMYWFALHDLPEFYIRERVLEALKYEKKFPLPAELRGLR